MADACNSCGAEIVFEAGKQSLTCPFCGGVNKIERPEDALETSFDLIVPISVTRQELENLAYAHMASGKFTPDDMLEASTITLRELFYVPAFAFKVDYDATWTASFGFDRKEPYTAHRTVHSNGRSHQESYTAYRTVTDWRPANGVDSGTFKVAGYGGSRLVGIPLAPIDLVEQTVMSGTATEFNPSFTTGFEIEKFSVPKKKVYDSLKSEINSIIGENVERHGQGDQQRDWHWNAKMSHAATTYAVPICHIAFQYDDKEYGIWVGGNDASAIRADELPVDKDKQKAANIGFIPGGLGLIATAGSTYFWGFAGVSLIATAIALGYGFMRRKSLIDYSKSIRSSLLTQMQASNQTGANLSVEHQSNVAKAFQRPVRPFFAQIHKDKILLPALAAFSFFGAVVPNATLSPTAVRQRAYAQYAAEQPAQNVEMQAAQDRVVQEAATQQAALDHAANQTQEETLVAENLDAAEGSLPDDAAEGGHSEAESQEVSTQESQGNTEAQAALMNNSAGGATEQEVLRNIGKSAPGTLLQLPKNVNLRSGPAASQALIAQLEKGSQVRVLKDKATRAEDDGTETPWLAVELAQGQFCAPADIGALAACQKWSSGQPISGWLSSKAFLNRSEQAPTTAHVQPSFDCSKASTLIENLICSDDGLAKLDSDLGKSYQAALSQFRGSGGDLVLKEDQKKWLKSSRNTCKNLACLKSAYQARLNEIAAFSRSAG